MSTNYYIIPTAAIENKISLDWVQQIHIAQFAAGAFLLQAVRGGNRFSRDSLELLVPDAATYWSPVFSFETLETWEQMRAVVLSSEFTVIDEYGAVHDSEDFVNRVENQERGADARFHDITEWRADNPYQLSPIGRTDYLDGEGYSFEIVEFS